MDPRPFQRGSRSSRVDLRSLECADTLLITTKASYVFVYRRLEWPLSSWDGGGGLRKIPAWRGPCQPFSGSSGLHRGLGTPQLRVGGTRGGNELCLSSSLHNRFITFYRKTPATSSVSTKKGDLSGLGNDQWGEECRASMAQPDPLASDRFSCSRTRQR
jgi:hypothetical protein